MRNWELRAKYDNMIESADIKILELSSQVNNNNIDQILKSIARETTEKMSKVLQDRHRIEFSQRKARRQKKWNSCKGE